jgi:hypothetical protein
VVCRFVGFRSGIKSDLEPTIDFCGLNRLLDYSIPWLDDAEGLVAVIVSFGCNSCAESRELSDKTRLEADDGVHSQFCQTLSDMFVMFGELSGRNSWGHQTMIRNIIGLLDRRIKGALLRDAFEAVSVVKDSL